MLKVNGSLFSNQELWAPDTIGPADCVTLTCSRKDQRMELIERKGEIRDVVKGKKVTVSQHLDSLMPETSHPALYSFLN